MGSFLFPSKIDEFCKERNIIHENSSPYNPQSNSLSESAVKQMKFLLKKVNENPNEFSSRLLDFRNTPNVCGKSPAQIFFGRRLRDRLPHLPGANDLEVSNAKAGANNRRLLMEQRENQHSTSLQPLSVNQKVLVQNPITKSWDDQGIITSSRPHGRSYEVLMDSGKTILRNRILLRPVSSQPKKKLHTGSPSLQHPRILCRSQRLSRNHYADFNPSAPPRGKL